MSATVDQESLKTQFNKAIDAMDEKLMQSVLAEVNDILRAAPEVRKETFSVLVHAVLNREKFALSEQKSLEKLRQAGADFEYMQDGQTSLLYAISAGKSGAALWFIQQGANVLVQDGNTQQTALMYAMVQDNWMLLMKCFEAVPKEKHPALLTTRDAQGYSIFDYPTLPGAYGDNVREFVAQWKQNNQKTCVPPAPSSVHQPLDLTPLLSSPPIVAHYDSAISTDSENVASTPLPLLPDPLHSDRGRQCRPFRNERTNNC